MTFQAYILIAEGEPLNYTATNNEGESFCVSHTFDLSHWDGPVWMVETEEEARKALAANQSGLKPVPWYNASYDNPSIASHLISETVVALAEVEFLVNFDPMPTLSLKIVSYKILEEGGTVQ